MPADAIAGIAEAFVGLIGLFVEMVLLVAELVAHLVLFIVWLIGRLTGKRNPVEHPAWLVKRRENRTGFAKTILTLALITAIGAGFATYHFAFTRIDVSDGIFSRPDLVSVTLHRDGATKDLVVEDGKLVVLRGRWDRLEVRDPHYLPAHAVIGGTHMSLRLSKVKSARDAATDAALGKAASLLLEKFIRSSAEGEP